jgi:hypothetical protein
MTDLATKGHCNNCKCQLQYCGNPSLRTNLPQALLDIALTCTYSSKKFGILTDAKIASTTVYRATAIMARVFFGVIGHDEPCPVRWDMECGTALRFPEAL